MKVGILKYLLTLPCRLYVSGMYNQSDKDFVVEHKEESLGVGTPTAETKDFFINSLTYGA